MKPIAVLMGHGVVLRRDDVDTDQIVPSKYCKRLTKTGYADALFAGWRADPEFVLNQMGSATASILVAGHNFGTGSSREHAVWALRDWGFGAVLASSFGDIFRRNALKNGLLAIQLDERSLEWLRGLIEGEPKSSISIDLVEQDICAAGRRIVFSIESRARWLLLQGCDEIALTLSNADQIERYEQGRPDWLPTLAPSDREPSDALRIQA
jgi:3-isopropylmalate/(R)-2-methylmalate dehydratase small subunit